VNALRLVTAAAVALALVSCSPRADPAPRLPEGAEGLRVWHEARAQLETLREGYQPDEPYSMNVALELTQQQLGKRMRARGAVAVHPPHALRMILLGPGGTTALDLWVCRDEFRFSVPAIDLQRRGDATTPAEELRGLPVDFLRWWFLRPFAGRLLSFVDSAATRRFVLRDGGQVIHLTAPVAFSELAQPPLAVRRVSLDDEERLEVDGRRCGSVAYQQRSTGIDIAVECEQLNAATPPTRAFADPDEPDRGCMLPKEERP